ncbi:hypothetical protein ACWEOE_41440, partial [Amycolatopsis sp. NPDC004368]
TGDLTCLIYDTPDRRRCSAIYLVSTSKQALAVLSPAARTRRARPPEFGGGAAVCVRHDRGSRQTQPEEDYG